MSISSDISDRLESLPEASAIAMAMNVDHYIDVIRGVLDNFLVKHDLIGVYITSTIPSMSIINVLRALDIDISRIYFVDCISHIMMGSTEKHQNAFFVESPTMLENIMLKVEFLMRKTKGKDKLVLLDSINSLAIHNNVKILSEFLHILVNNLRSKNARTVILNVGEQGSEEINNMMGLVCDDIMVVEGE